MVLRGGIDFWWSTKTNPTPKTTPHIPHPNCTREGSCYRPRASSGPTYYGQGFYLIHSKLLLQSYYINQSLCSPITLTCPLLMSLSPEKERTGPRYWTNRFAYAAAFLLFSQVQIQMVHNITQICFPHNLS